MLINVKKINETNMMKCYASYNKEVTIYKNVYKLTPPLNGMPVYQAKMNSGTCKMYDTIEEAARAIDIFLIKHSKKPINILKSK